MEQPHTQQITQIQTHSKHCSSDMAFRTSLQKTMQFCTKQKSKTIFGHVNQEQSRIVSTKVNNNKDGTEVKAPIKPFSSIPGPRGIPMLGSALELARGEKHSLHKLIHKYYKQYRDSPIFKLKLGATEMLILRKPEEIERVWKRQGSCPRRQNLEHWIMHRELRGLKKALILSDGEEWQRNRSAFNAQMMRPQNVQQHTENFSNVARDFVQQLQNEISEKGRIPDLRKSLFYWSFESACTTILDKRMGLLGSRPPEDVQQFIRAIQTVLATTDTLLPVPPKVARALRLPAQRMHFQAWDDLFKAGDRFAMEQINAMHAERAAGRPTHGLIASVVENSSLTQDEIVASLIDIMMGAVDTTSGSVFWALYALSKHQAVQQKLYEEIVGLVGPRGTVGQTELRQMPYMKAFYKEVLRVYPLAPITNRVTQENMTIAGHHIPAGTLAAVANWSMGQDTDIYSDPENFRPDRWLRENALVEQIHPHASLPFGQGPRACIGRRVAELQSYVLLSKILQNYKLKDGSPSESLDTMMCLILVPSGENNIIFEKRFD